MHLTVFLPFFDILDPNAHPMSDRSRGDSLGHFLHRCVIFRVRVQRISVLISMTVRRECGRRAIESDAQRYAGANSTADAVVNLVLSFHPGNDSSTSQAPGRRSLCQNTVVLLWWNFVIIAFSTCLAVWHTAFGFAMCFTICRITERYAEWVPVSRSNGKWSKTKIRSNSSGK